MEQSAPIAIVCAAMQDTPASSKDRFLVKAAFVPADGVEDEATFWKSAPPSELTTSRKFGVTLVEKILEAVEEETEFLEAVEEEEENTETETEEVSHRTAAFALSC